MSDFKLRIQKFFAYVGEYKNMVLSTSFQDNVTSRMMSIVIFDDCLYFQTDITSEKAKQIRNNANVSLCFDNVSIEGQCNEIGKPNDNQAFSNLFKKHYNWAYNKYSFIENEKLFVVKPTYIKKWIYDNSEPYVENYDCVNKLYSKKKYDC